MSYPWQRGNTLKADELNAAIAAAVQKAGDTMTGPLNLSGPPTANSHAANKQYVDAQIAANLGGGGGGGGGAAITVSDTPPGTPAQNQLWFDSVNCQLYVWFNDGTSQQWVNTTNAGIGPSIIISDTAPSSPNVGQLWWDSVGLQLYIYYNDGNSTQWVPADNQNSALAEAPQDGRLYGRKNAGWSSTVVEPQLQNNNGRNWIHNSQFRVQQRGQGPWGGAALYTADRWLQILGTDTSTSQISTLTDGNRTDIGDEFAAVTLQSLVVSAGSAASFTLFQQRIPEPRQLSNKTVTVSFWASGDTNARKLGVSLDQIFGTGGSPSAAVNGNGQLVSLSTAFQRFSLVFNIPSTAGKTFGTNADAYTQINFWTSCGTTNALRSGSCPVQNGAVINLFGVQLEIGGVATPFEKIDMQQDYAKCLRFYCSETRVRSYAWNSWGAGAWLTADLAFPVPLRTGPSVVNYILSGGVNYSGVNLVSSGTFGAQLQLLATAGGAASVNLTTWNASADL